MRFSKYKSLIIPFYAKVIIVNDLQKELIMRDKDWARLAFLILILVFILSCGISFNMGNDSGNTDLAIEQTMQVIRQTQTAAVQAAQPHTPAEQPPVDEPLPPGPTPTATIDPEMCNISHMTSETIPDGTQFDPGDIFTKSWTLRNNGICDWTTDYRFVFESGDRMGGAISQNLPHEVKPHDTITFSVDLTTPGSNGDYSGTWRLLADDGEKLGFYWVKIRVGPPFAVTSVTYYMPHTTIDTGCPNDINVKAEITSNSEGKVTYKWEDSAGGSSSTKSVTFTEAGKKIVDYNVTVGATGDYWAKLYVDDPNHQWFGSKEFHVNCTP